MGDPRTILWCLIALSCGGQAPNATGRNETAEAGALAAGPSSANSESRQVPTRTEIHNVDLRLMEGAILHVEHLVGQATSSRPGEPVGLDDKLSYKIVVEGAERSVGYADMSQVMNEYTFAFDGAPVKGLELAQEEDADERDEVELKGRLRKGLHLPFEIEGRPEVTPDGRIRIRTTSIQALDLQVGGLMHALGLEPKDLLGNLEERGLGFAGDDLILDASRAFPPPRIAGRVTVVRVGENGLSLSLGSGNSRSTSGRSNYLWFRKGIIKIGKMTQTDADLWIVDQDPKDPLDFYPDSMTRQLEAGYAKIEKSGGLTLYVPDYGDIH